MHKSLYQFWLRALGIRSTFGRGIVSHDTSSASSKRTSDALKTTRERQKSQRAQQALQRLRNPGLKAPFLADRLRAYENISSDPLPYLSRT